MDDHRRGVRERLLAPAGEPAPAAVAVLHFGQLLHAVLDHPRHLVVVEHRVGVKPLPTGGARFRVADFLGIQVGPHLADLLEVEAHADQDFLGDDGGQKAIERLLGAAVGIGGQIGQGIDHRGGQARAIADFEHRLALAALGGHIERDLAHCLFRPQAPEKESILSMPWT